MQPNNMVVVFVRDEYGLNLRQRKSEPFHAFFDLAARDAGINEYRFLAVADVVTVAVAAGIK